MDHRTEYGNIKVYGTGRVKRFANNCGRLRVQGKNVGEMMFVNPEKSMNGI